MIIRKKMVKAVSLTELMVTLGISTLIIGAGMLIFTTTRISLSRAEALIHAEEQARITLGRMANELRLSNAFHVMISDDIGTTVNNNSGDTINFQIPVGSYNDEGIYLTDALNLQWGSNTTNGNYLTYSLTNEKTLVRGEFSELDGSDATSAVIARNVSSLTFYRDNPSSTTINIEIKVQDDKNLGLTRTLISTVKLRN